MTVLAPAPLDTPVQFGWGPGGATTGLTPGLTEADAIDYFRFLAIEAHTLGIGIGLLNTPLVSTPHLANPTAVAKHTLRLYLLKLLQLPYATRHNPVRQACISPFMAVSRPLVPLVCLLPADSGQRIRREHGEHGLGRERVVVSGFGQTGTTPRHTTTCHAAWVLSCVVRARGWYAYMTAAAGLAWLLLATVDNRLPPPDHTHNTVPERIIVNVASAARHQPPYLPAFACHVRIY